MDREQAAALLTLIEVATEGRWPHVAARVQELGYTPGVVIAAFESLEEDAGMAGQAPGLSDF